LVSVAKRHSRPRRGLRSQPGASAKRAAPGKVPRRNEPRRGDRKRFISQIFRPCRGSALCNSLSGGLRPRLSSCRPSGAPGNRVSRQKLAGSRLEYFRANLLRRANALAHTQVHQKRPGTLSKEHCLQRMFCLKQPPPLVAAVARCLLSPLCGSKLIAFPQHRLRDTNLRNSLGG
jgi:hypothetical protein